MMISKKEKLKLYKTAEEQIQTRIVNKTGLRKAIIETFDRLDIETLCPGFIKAKKAKGKLIRDEIDRADVDVIKRIKVKKMLKEDKSLESWAVGDEFGMRDELKKLRDEYAKRRLK